MPKNINGSNSNNSGGIFSNIIVNLFEARLNSNANNFLVYNSSPLAPLFKIDGLNSIATFYCDVDVVGNASFTTVDNIAVKSSMISLAQDNTANDLIDIGFYGEYKTAGVVKYRGLVKNVNAGKWILFKDIITPPSSIVTLAGSYRDDLDVNNLYWGDTGDNLVTLRSDVNSFPVELKTLTSGVISQLTNIGNNLISSIQWGYISNMNQTVVSSSAPTFNGASFNDNISISSASISGSGTPYVFFKTNNVNRYMAGLQNAETGSGNVGGDFRLFSYSDSGVYLANPIAIKRATNTLSIEGPVNLLSTSDNNNGNLTSGFFEPSILSVISGDINNLQLITYTYSRIGKIVNVGISLYFDLVSDTFNYRIRISLPVGNASIGCFLCELNTPTLTGIAQISFSDAIDFYITKASTLTAARYIFSLVGQYTTG
jgi:hypothetical protein